MQSNPRIFPAPLGNPSREKPCPAESKRLSLLFVAGTCPFKGTVVADKKKPVPDHPSQDSTNRFPLDKLLRDRGWELKRRPKHGPAIWEHRESRKRMTFDQALRTLDQNDVADAEYTDFLESGEWKQD